MEIKKIAVLGAGLMGHGITQVAATAGFEVNMRDIEERFLSSGMEKISRSAAASTPTRCCPTAASRTCGRKCAA